MEPKLCFVWLPHITKPVDQDNDDNDDDDDHAIVFHLLDDICNDSEIYHQAMLALEQQELKTAMNPKRNYTSTLSFAFAILRSTLAPTASSFAWR